jgi:DNA-directed RNA polymerase II subunit RPB3
VLHPSYFHFPSQTSCPYRDITNGAEKAEWPLSQNANFEAPPQPSAPFDYNAVPSTFYFDIEASGSVPVREVVTQGLDILAMNLAKVIEGVEIETGGRDEDDADGGMGLVEPVTGGEYYGGAGGEYYGGGGGGGNGMSPLRR